MKAERADAERLPDCMMPDGAEPCVGYQTALTNLYEQVEITKRLQQERDDATREAEALRAEVGQLRDRLVDAERVRCRAPYEDEHGEHSCDIDKCRLETAAQPSADDVERQAQKVTDDLLSPHAAVVIKETFRRKIAAALAAARAQGIVLMREMAASIGRRNQALAEQAEPGASAAGWCAKVAAEIEALPVDDTLRPT